MQNTSFGESKASVSAYAQGMPVSFTRMGLPAEVVLEEINGFCANDHRYKDGRVFNSISSEPLPIAIYAYLRAIETNMGDNRIFPGMKAMEECVIRMAGQLLGNDGAAGSVVSGATEGNLLALYVAKRIGERKGITRPEVVVPHSGHFSLDKIAALLNVKLVRTALDERQRGKVAAIKEAINERTIAIVATAATSEFCAIDPVPQIAQVAREHDLYMHVDAASGGFIIPFARRLGRELPDFDFSLEAVHSIAVDPHKFGLCVIPSGIILFRSEELQREVCFESHYVGTYSHATLLGTRPGAGVATVYAVLRHLGSDGFCSIVEENFSKRDFFIAEAERRGLELLFPPELLIVAVKSRNPSRLMQAMEEKGWLVSVSRRVPAIRIVIQHHLTRNCIIELLNDWCALEEALQ
jgi:tyrosine decarboxylase / aspartate 1-decarboxylase